jgi:hypothetical protein
MNLDEKDILESKNDFDKWLEEMRQESVDRVEKNRLEYEAYLAAGGCAHSKCIPIYDSERVRKKIMSAEEVRRLYPRFFGNCPDCGQQLIQYASFEHYLAGDW